VQWQAIGGFLNLCGAAAENTCRRRVPLWPDPPSAIEIFSPLANERYRTPIKEHPIVRIHYIGLLLVIAVLAACGGSSSSQPAPDEQDSPVVTIFKAPT
jgi:hypothetical protein